MITILHGDDIASSYNHYMNLREKEPSKKIVEASNISLVDLMQVFSGNGLFGDQETIFLEQLISKRKSPKEIEELLIYLNKQDNGVIVLWESKELTPKQVGLIKNATVKLFKTPTIVFSFLDSIAPNNTKEIVKKYHELLVYEDANYALFMLMRQIRILLVLSDNSAESTITEVSRMAPWQKGKMQKQAKSFTSDHLVNLHNDLFQLELGNKTGTLAQPLSQAIDFFLLTI